MFLPTAFHEWFFFAYLVHTYTLHTFRLHSWYFMWASCNLSKQLSSATVYPLRCISGFASEDVLRLANLELFSVQPAV